MQAEGLNREKDAMPLLRLGTNPFAGNELFGSNKEQFISYFIHLLTTKIEQIGALTPPNFIMQCAQVLSRSCWLVPYKNEFDIQILAPILPADKLHNLANDQARLLFTHPTFGILRLDSITSIASALQIILLEVIVDTGRTTYASFFYHLRNMCTIPALTSIVSELLSFYNKFTGLNLTKEALQHFNIAFLHVYQGRLLWILEESFTALQVQSTIFREQDALSFLKNLCQTCKNQNLPQTLPGYSFSHFFVIYPKKFNEFWEDDNNVTEAYENLINAPAKALEAQVLTYIKKQRIFSLLSQKLPHYSQMDFGFFVNICSNSREFYQNVALFLHPHEINTFNEIFNRVFYEIGILDFFQEISNILKDYYLSPTPSQFELLYKSIREIWTKDKKEFLTPYELAYLLVAAIKKYDIFEVSEVYKLEKLISLHFNIPFVIEIADLNWEKYSESERPHHKKLIIAYDFSSQQLKFIIRSKNESQFLLLNPTKNIFPFILFNTSETISSQNLIFHYNEF